MRTILALFALLLPATARAQPTPADEAMAAVTALFEGMKAADSSAVAHVLHPDARLVTAAVREGVPAVVPTPIPAFLAGVAGAAPGALDERLYDVEVRADGTMAAVWAPYRFYLNGQFSHCGVNQFTLARTADGWKILHILDTRRRADCTME